MPEPPFWLFSTIITIAIALGVTNGFNDAANAIATVIGTRTLSPRQAITMAVFLNFAGTMTGTAVALTIGKGILKGEALQGILGHYALFAALLTVVIWVLFATRLGLPVSSSHSLVAGLAGAGIATVGSSAINWGTLANIASAVVCAPALGFAGGFIVMVILLWAVRDTLPPKVRSLFSKLQLFSSAFIAYSHGKNDGQMPMGIIALALMLHYNWSEFYIPFWVIAVSAASISLGTALGGWRVIRTVGMRITALQPIHGFAAEASAAAVIEIASLFGIPVSTTHCVSASIMGVGATRRLSAVRWGVAGNIIIAWIATFPICAILGWLFAQLLLALA
jgi:PiT family inorganic phosphate transporter